MSEVTVVGCGMMGSNLVSAFMDAGHQVTIVDVNDRAARPFVERGARFSPALADALDAKFVVFSLPDDDVVRAVLASCPEGSLAGRTFVNTSSEVPSDVLDVQRIVEGAGGRYIDSTILTYQGEVGTEYGYLLYSGDAEAFRAIEDDLRALSDPPVFLGDETAVAAEIVDLVAIASHFGFPYTPLEAIGLCAERGADVDAYLDMVEGLLPRLADDAQVLAEAVDLDALMEAPLQEALDALVFVMDADDVFTRLDDAWLGSTNKSVANHYRKMLGITRSNFEY